MKLILFALSCWALTPVAFAQNAANSAATRPAVEIPLGEGDRLVIRGVHAQINLVGGAGGSSLKVRGLEGEGNYSWKKENNLIVIENEWPTGKKEWREFAGAPSTRVLLEISGPAVNTEVFLREGGVSAQRWGRSLRVQMKQGKVLSTASSGPLQASLQKGDIQVLDTTGAYDLDVFQGQVFLRQPKAEGKITVHSGQLNVEGGQGRLEMKSHGAAIKLTRFSGQALVEQGKGSLQALTFSGRLEAHSVEGPLTVQGHQEADFVLKSKSGRIQVQLPARSGASLNLSTQEGDLSVPSELRVNRAGLAKSARGRLRGEGSNFSVNAQSQEGGIIVK